MLAHPHLQLCRLSLAEVLTDITSGAFRLASLVTQGNAALAVAGVDGDTPESTAPDGHRHFLFADRQIRVQGTRITKTPSGLAARRPPFGKLTAAA